MELAKKGHSCVAELSRFPSKLFIGAKTEKHPVIVSALPPSFALAASHCLFLHLLEVLAEREKKRVKLKPYLTNVKCIRLYYV